MINGNNRELHHRRYLKLAVTIFTLVGIGHLLRSIYEWPIVIAGWEMPLYLSWLALFVTACMVLMGIVYLRK